MALTHIGDFTLLEINIGLAAALGFLNPMALQLDAILTGQFGLGPFLADLQAQFNAAIAAIASIQFSINFNAFASIQALIAAMASLLAALQGLVTLPAVTLALQAQLAATASLLATLQLRIGGIKALLAAILAIKIPAVKFIAELTANLSLGPVHLLSFTGDDLSPTGALIAAQFAVGLPSGTPGNEIAPFFETVDGLILVTKSPAAFAGISAILKTS